MNSGLTFRNTTKEHNLLFNRLKFGFQLLLDHAVCNCANLVLRSLQNQIVNVLFIEGRPDTVLRFPSRNLYRIFFRIVQCVTKPRIKYSSTLPVATPPVVWD